MTVTTPLLILVLLALSGFADSLGFFYASKIWQGGLLSWGDLGRSALGWAVGISDPHTPVLFIAPSGDYPLLRASKETMFNALPPNPLTRLYQPDSSHLGAPAASIDEIARWTAEVAASGSAAPVQPPPR